MAKEANSGATNFSAVWAWMRGARGRVWGGLFGGEPLLPLLLLEFCSLSEMSLMECGTFLQAVSPGGSVSCSILPVSTVDVGFFEVCLIL